MTNNPGAFLAITFLKYPRLVRLGRDEVGYGRVDSDWI